MNENIDFTQILKNCPKGTKFYSSVYGDLYFDSMYVSSSASRIYFTDYNSRSIVSGEYLLIEYLRSGRIYPLKGECTLFPSKDQRDWSKFTAPWLKKKRFDPRTLKPFDKVLVRDTADDKWICEHFSYMIHDNNEWACMATIKYLCCIPYNDETKHLVGTKDEAPEFYKYWEE